MARVLLLGTSFSAAPLLAWLKQKGHQVAVCGRDASDPCVSWADAYFPLDYADVAAVRDLVQRERMDCLVPSCNDAAYATGVTIAAEFGFDGYDHPETAKILYDKAKFRSYCERWGFPVPRFFVAEEGGNVEELREFNYPLLVKPSRSFSGRGIVRVEDEKHLFSVLQSFEEGRFVIEEMIPGTLHSISAFFCDHHLEFSVFVDEFCTVYPYAVNCSNAPSRLTSQIQRHVSDCVSELGGKLNLVDGLLHVQFMVTPKGDFFLIEAMRRCPGDLYYYLVNWSIGFPYLNAYLSPFLGNETGFLSPPVSTVEPWARHTVSCVQEKVLGGFGIQLSDCEMRVFPLATSGRRFAAAPFDKMAIIFFRFPDCQTLWHWTEKLAQTVQLWSPCDSFRRPVSMSFS